MWNAADQQQPKCSETIVRLNTPAELPTPCGSVIVLNFGGIQLDYEEMGTAAAEEFHAEAVELENMMNHMKISWMIQGGARLYEANKQK